MTRYLRYIYSIFSIKKLTYKDVSLSSYWDENSTFTKHTRIGPRVRLFYSKIGIYSRISSGCSVVFASIGNFVSIASDTQIGAGRHPLNYASTSQLFYNKNSLKNEWVKNIDYEQNLPITIESDVWIGTNSYIMGGITIGAGAVVGAKSLVTKDVPPYAIVGGVPAKIIKYRFSEEIIERLLEIKWWDFTDEEITRNIEFFRDPNLTAHKLNTYFPKKIS